MNAQLALDLTDEQRAELLVMQACQDYFAAQPDVLAYIVRFIRGKAAQGRRTSIKAAIEDMRYNAPAEWATRAYKWNNTWTSAASRIITALYPELAPFIRQRKSQFDAHGVPNATPRLVER